MRLHFYLCLLFLCCKLVSFSQPTAYQRLTVEAGLINNLVLGATQDQKGFLWFATISGIDRYDGKNFQHFKLPLDSSKGYEFNQIAWISRDNNGTIWVSTRHQLFRFDQDHKSFEPIYNFSSPENSTLALAFFIDHKNNIWTATSTGLLVLPANATSRQIKRITNTTAQYGSITQAPDGKIWTMLDNRISCYQYKNNVIQEVQAGFELPPSKLNAEIITLYTDSSNTLWMGTREHGLLAYDLNNRQWKSLTKLNTAIKGTAIRSITHSSKTSELLVATDGQGLFRIQPASLKFYKEAYHPDHPSSISNNAIYHVFEDKFQRIWISTYGGGINYTRDLPPFQTFTHIVNVPASLYNDMARSAVEDEQHRIWFGTSKGISIYSPQTQQWQYLSLDKSNQYENGQNVLALLNSGDGFIWAGTYGEGLKKIKAANHSIVASYNTSEADQSPAIATNYIFCLYQDRAKRIWAGGIRGGITVIDADGAVIDNFPLRDIHAITEDADGNILLVGTNGLFQINYATKDVKRLLPKSEGVRFSFNSICRLNKNLLALGSNGTGIYLYDLLQQKPVAHFTEKNGLPSNFIAGILQDQQGRLWISTTNGLSCLNLKDSTFLNYAHADGLPGNQFNSRASYQLPSGNMIFGGTNGFVYFDPTAFNRKQHSSKLVFTAFRVGHQTILADQENAILSKDIDDTDTLQLKYNQHSFSLDFITISSEGTEKNLYSWKLDGFDTSWSPLSANSTANYTNLDPGKYTLRIASVNNGLFNNGKERKLEIIIHQPWYKTGWAYFSYLVLLLLFAAGLRKAIKISMARKRYQERIQFFSNIAHDLRTPLTLISTPINALLHKNNLDELDRNTLQLAERNANRLNRLVTQLLDFQKADLKKMSILAAAYNIPRILNELLQSFQPLLKEKKIQLEFVSLEEELNAWIDLEKFEKIIYNLISNAIKYSKPGGTITVIISVTSANWYRIQITDTGIGIPEKQQQFLFNQYYRANNTANLQETGSGLGLVLTKHLVELHKGKISFSSMEAHGTTFQLELPLGDIFSAEEKIPATAHSTLAASENLTTANGKRKERILVVEDNMELRHFIMNSLSALYQVLSASNGVDAIKICKEHEVHLVVSDIMMPEMDGYTLCTQLKSATATCHIPIILLTAIQDEEYRMDGMQAGADDYIEKPFKMDYLKSRIENLLKSREVMKQKFYTTIDTSKLPAEDNTDGQFLHRAMEIITENIGNPSFSIEELCHSMTVSRPVLFRKIKSLTGLAPQDFIKNIRLKKAAELLISKQHSISEISFLTGFGDAKYFSTSFKKKFGMSPSEYAKN